METTIKTGGLRLPPFVEESEGAMVAATPLQAKKPCVQQSSFSLTEVTRGSIYAKSNACDPSDGQDSGADKQQFAVALFRRGFGRIEFIQDFVAEHSVDELNAVLYGC